MNRVLFGFGLSVVSIALAGVVQEGAIAGNYFPKEIAKRIAKSTSASVLLPSEDSFKKTFFSDDRNIFATTNTADQYKEYSLNFSPIPDCNANVCMRFSVSAKRGKEINTQIAQGRNASSEYIELVDGSKALASTHCGASCWGVVQWKYQNILYEVWTKARGAEGAISIANSMVKVGDRSKSSSIATDNRSTQSIANLPDGSYFYGETQNPRQMASQFVIFRKKGDVVFGQEYFTNTGSNSCFVGQIKSGNTLSRVTQAILGEPIRRGEANWEFPEKSSLDLGSLNNRESLK